MISGGTSGGGAPENQYSLVSPFIIHRLIPIVLHSNSKGCLEPPVVSPLETTERIEKKRHLLQSTISEGIPGDILGTENLSSSTHLRISTDYQAKRIRNDLEGHQKKS